MLRVDVPLEPYTVYKLIYYEFILYCDNIIHIQAFLPFCSNNIWPDSPKHLILAIY